MENSSKEKIIKTYRKRASNYDITANLYYLLGYREWAYRKKAVRALNLNPGDTILDLACGTGLNFPLYQKAVGPNGIIIGIDITDAMLVQAQDRINEFGWKNVSLIQHDATTYHNTSSVDAVISTFALSLFPNPEHVLKNIFETLKPRGRFVLLDLQIPQTWPSLLKTAAITLMKPFAITQEWVDQKPWMTIQRTVNRLFSYVKVEQYYFGLTYLISGEKSSRN